MAMHEFIDIQGRQNDNVLKYCIVISLLLHVVLAAGLPHFTELVPTKAALRPGETVTPVRLIESQLLPNKLDKPPEKASAISDRDHRTERERLPKLPPSPTPPVGKIDPSQPRIASLAPPSAPEDLIRDEESPKNQDHEIKNSQEDKSISKSKAKPRDNTVKKSSIPNKEQRVDLRPTPQEIEKGLSSGGGTGSPDLFPDGEVEEATVDINTREDKFFSYLLHLKNKIQGVWVYPSSASQSGLGGSLSVEFSIARDGQLLYVNLMDSSGHSILDESALRAIRSAAPYFPFPSRLKAKRLKIRANFIYVTNSYFRNIM